MPATDASRTALQRLVPSGQVQHPQGRGRQLWFLIVFLLGLLITSLFCNWLSISAANDQRLTFEREASQMEAALQTEFDLAFEYLHAIPPFFQASDEVTSADFRLFVSDAIHRHSSIHALEYLPRVPAAERQSFEAMVRRETGITEFAIRAVDANGKHVPLPQRDDYFPVYFGEPPIPGVFGIDLLSHPEQSYYLQLARESNSPVATRPLSLIEDAPDVLSVIAFAPIREASTSDIGDCDGMAVLILRIRPVVEIALGESGLRDFQLTLIDRDVDDHGQLVYKNYSGDPLTKSRDRWPKADRRIRFADQAWDLTLSPSYGSEFAPVGFPWWAFLAGVALSTLAAYSLSATIAIGGYRKQMDAAIELGQYRLGKKLGEGAMGVVYEAEHQLLARPAAIKLIQLDGHDFDSQDNQLQATRSSRFEKEARATASLESPHTIRVYDFGKTPDGAFYYVMELLHGINLSNLVKSHGPIPQARTIHLMRQACRSLSEAHQQGLIHRDVKPANLFVCEYALEYDFVKVLDFGLVKSVNNEQSPGTTEAGIVVGTPAFIAPETLLGDPVDGRADLYSLGCVMFWLLAGRAPFEGETATAVLAKQMTAKPESLRSIVNDAICEELDQLVLQCLAKKPKDRPASAQQLGERLDLLATRYPWTQQEAKQCWQREQDTPSFAGECFPTSVS